MTSKCTEIFGHSTTSRSCSKICLVRVYPAGQTEKALKMYAVLDEQSNRSLAKTAFFDHFNINGPLEPYTLKTGSGVMEATGRHASNFVVESLDVKRTLSLPTLIECDMIPDDRTEIPSPAVAYYYPHLKAIANKIPEILFQMLKFFSSSTETFSVCTRSGNSIMGFTMNLTFNISTLDGSLWEKCVLGEHISQPV